MKGHINQAGPPNDTNLKAPNIVVGKSLYGIAGTCMGKCVAGADFAIASLVPAVTTSATTLTKVREISVNMNGTLRVQYKLASNHDAAAEGAVYKNGSLADGASVDGPAGITQMQYTHDIAVVPGDLVQIYARSTSGSYVTSVSEFYITGLRSTYAEILL